MPSSPAERASSHVVISKPCIGSHDSALSTSVSSVPLMGVSWSVITDAPLRLWRECRSGGALSMAAPTASHGPRARYLDSWKLVLRRPDANGSFDMNRPRCLCQNWHWHRCYFDRPTATSWG